jgi:hypothetical protein
MQVIPNAKGTSSICSLPGTTETSCPVGQQAFVAVRMTAHLSFDCRSATWIRCLPTGASVPATTDLVSPRLFTATHLEAQHFVICIVLSREQNT